MVTRGGIIKRTPMRHFAKINKNGLIALNIREDDALIAVLKTNGSSEIFAATASGMGIRFPESEVRPMGRSASGVKAITLREGDRLVGVTAAEGSVLFVSTNGYGKCTPVTGYRSQHRGGMGLVVYKPSDKTGPLVGVSAVSEKDELMLINSEGIIIRLRVAEISIQGRYAHGVKLIQMDEGVTVAGMTKIAEADVEGLTDAEEADAPAEEETMA
jgi:DNA gyrase subunit A